MFLPFDLWPALTVQIEWIIWAPLFTISAGFLLAVISADYRAALLQTGETSDGKVRLALAIILKLI